MICLGKAGITGFTLFPKFIASLLPINCHSYGHDGNLFLQELQSVEIAIQQLEALVNESEANQASEREPFSAVRADLEKIWSLKKEVEYLEASLKSKASLLQKSLTLKPVMSELCHGWFLDPIWNRISLLAILTIITSKPCSVSFMSLESVTYCTLITASQFWILWDG